MFDAHEFTKKFQLRILSLRRQALYFRIAGFLFRFFGPVLLATGAIEGFALAQYNDPFVNILRVFGVAAWFWMDRHFPTLWAVLRTISPYPRLAQPLPLVSWLGWMGWGFGLALFGLGLLNRSKRLQANAARAEDMLNSTAALLSPAQTLQEMAVINADVSTRIKNMGERDDTKWWITPVGLIAVSAVVTIISKFIHTTDLVVFSIAAASASASSILFHHLRGSLQRVKKASIIIQNEDGRKVSVEFDPSKEESVSRFLTELEKATRRHGVD